MINRRKLGTFASAALVAATLGLGAPAGAQDKGELVYMTPGLDVAFWRYVSEGVRSVAEANGYGFSALDSTNDPQTQLQNAQDSIARGVAGIILSPTDSSTAPAVLGLAQDAGIPVVIADIGTDSGEFVSVIGSNNYEGAFGVGEALAAAMNEAGKADCDRGDHRHQPGAPQRPGPHQRLQGRNGGRRRHRRGRPPADAGLYRRRDVQVHPGHDHREPGHGRHVHPDRRADARRASRDQGGADGRRTSRRGLRRHSGIRAASAVGRAGRRRACSSPT